MKLMMWNCQRAASKEFLRVLNNYVKHNRTDIVALFEPRISGDFANVVCRKIGFDNWIRVEAIGFNGGIWIFWNDLIQVKNIRTHPQFILLRFNMITCPIEFSSGLC